MNFQPPTSNYKKYRRQPHQPPTHTITRSAANYKRILRGKRKIMQFGNHGSRNGSLSGKRLRFPCKPPRLASQFYPTARSPSRPSSKGLCCCRFRANFSRIRNWALEYRRVMFADLCPNWAWASSKPIFSSVAVAAEFLKRYGVHIGIFWSSGRVLFALLIACSIA